MQKDRELRKVPRACQSTGRAGEAEWTLQEPEAIGAELVRQASLLGTGTFGVLDTLRQLRSKGSSLLRPSAIRAGEREDGNCHRPLAMRPIGTAMSAPGPEPGPEWHERVPSESDF